MSEKNVENDKYADIRSDFDEALRLRDAGSFIEAEAILSQLARQRPDVAAVHGMLGDLREKLGKLREAVASYQRSTELNPSSELASISLFHALYQLGELDAALEEMRRFRTRRSSLEYDRLVRDLRLNIKDGV